MGMSALGTGLASAGLATQGWNDAEMDQQRVQQGRQATELGQMGLEEATVARDLSRATRKTAADAYSSGKTMGQTYDQIADMYRQNGRSDLAQQTMDLAEALRQKGVTRAAMAYMNGHTDPADAPQSAPVPRPDLARYIDGITDPNSLMADNKGNIFFVDPKTGQKISMNAGRLLELEGVIKPKKLEVIPSDAMAVQTGPGVDPSLPKNQIRNPKRHAPQIVKPGERLVDESGKEMYNAPDTEGADPHKIREDLNDITKGIAELGKDYADTDMSDPSNPKKTLTQKGRDTALIAEQLKLANPTWGAQTIIEIAKNVDIKKGVLINDATGEMAIESGGKRYSIRVPRGAAMQSSPPAAQAPAAPAAKPKAAVRPPPPPAGLEGVGSKPINVTPEDYRNAETARETRRAKRESADAAQRAERKKRQEAITRGAEQINNLYRRPGYNKGGKVKRYGL